MNTSEKKRNISIEYKALVVLSIMLLFLALTIVFDVFFINTFAGWCYSLIAGG